MSVTFVAEGDVATFDASAFRTSLLSLFPAAIDVLLTVAAASVSIDSQIVFPAAHGGTVSDEAENVQNVLANTPADDLSASVRCAQLSAFPALRPPCSPPSLLSAHAHALAGQHG